MLRGEINRRECLVTGAALAAAALLPPSASAQGRASSPEALFADERIETGAGFPALAMFRRGASDKPLALCIPGGGHLARIYYGHPQARREDFLLAHLVKSGFSTLALSYPTSHPALKTPIPGMTIRQWAESSAAIAASYLAREKLPARVIVVGWSLGGRIARDIALAFRALKIELELFVGLSAAPPMPGFGSLQRSALVLTREGLRDDSSAQSPIFRSREAALAVIDRINGRVVIEREAYARSYVADSPINFRGEAERYSERGLIQDIATAIDDQGTFDFASYPLCGVIAAGGQPDARHAVTSAAAWGMLNTQALYFQRIKPVLDARELDARKWMAVRELMEGLIRRLSRHVDGSHFFFVGEVGAAAVARHIQDLVAESAAIRRELSALLA
jgi:pimeloyl-ACP methyl ester carboxylesterase